MDKLSYGPSPSGDIHTTSRRRPPQVAAPRLATTCVGMRRYAGTPTMRAAFLSLSSRSLALSCRRNFPRKPGSGACAIELDSPYDSVTRTAGGGNESVRPGARRSSEWPVGSPAEGI
eukprot:scaffold35445_cov112-Isochrysis_galbana.AAC.3